jgi:NAD(P)-dependent dehydrogenase (short-subunit alcohol dehydrogenase family)
MAARAALTRARAMSFDGATVLITGGSRGLGLLLAREFGRKGARVAIAARDAAELDRAQGDLTARGITSLPLRCDVADAAGVEAVVRDIVDLGERSTSS